MAVTVETFLDSYPEFNPAGEPLIQAKLDDAALLVDADIWGTREDMGVMLTTAHLLAQSPFGQQARLVSKDGSSTYSRELARMQVIVAGGGRLVP